MLPFQIPKKNRCSYPRLPGYFHIVVELGADDSRRWLDALIISVVRNEELKIMPLILNENQSHKPPQEGLPNALATAGQAAVMVERCHLSHKYDQTPSNFQTA